MSVYCMRVCVLVYIYYFLSLNFYQSMMKIKTHIVSKIKESTVFQTLCCNAGSIRMVCVNI